MQEDHLRGQDPQELLLLREALLTTVLQVVVHVLRDRVVGSVLEDVYPKVGLELLHFLKGFKEWGNVKVVVVLEPITRPGCWAKKASASSRVLRLLR